jgi:hypothetical protein
LLDVAPSDDLRVKLAGERTPAARRVASDGADDEGLADGLHDFLGDGADLVDFQDAVDLGDVPAGQAEVPAGDAVDRGDGLGGGVVVGVVQVQVGPLPGQDERLLAGGQRPVVVDEPDAAVELGVAGKALSMPGMPMRTGPRLLRS